MGRLGQRRLPDHVGGFFHVYIAVPLLGGILAALVFTRLLEPLMRTPSDRCACPPR